MKNLARAGVLCALGLLFFPAVHAQEIVPDTVTVVKAKVLSVENEGRQTVPGTGVSTDYQTIRATILEGERSGDTVTIDNDFLALKAGDVFYAVHTVNAYDGRDTYGVSDPYRLPALAGFGLLFLACLVVCGGWQGIRGLISLAISLFFIGYLLIPGILGGYSPLAVSTGVAMIIIVAGSYVTHGINRTTSAAIAGMIVTVAITGILAYTAVHAAHLSGFTTEESVYLNFNTQGSIDLIGLLLGSLMIGILGVLYDAAIGQAVAVEELYAMGPGATRRRVFSRALRIGREHIGALVNTLAIAYVGVSLPLLLLLKVSTTQSWMVVINQEMFATEILRTLIGSTGLLLAVPATTAMAVLMLHGRETRARREHAHRH